MVYIIHVELSSAIFFQKLKTRGQNQTSLIYMIGAPRQEGYHVWIVKNAASNYNFHLLLKVNEINRSKQNYYKRYVYSFAQ